MTVGGAAVTQLVPMIRRNIGDEVIYSFHNNNSTNPNAFCQFSHAAVVHNCLPITCLFHACTIDDDSYYSRDRSRSRSREPKRNQAWNPSRSQDRSKSHPCDFDRDKNRRYGMQSTDRYEGGAKDHGRYQRSQSYAASTGIEDTSYNGEAATSMDFRRGRSSSVVSSRSEPPFKRERHVHNSTSRPRFGSTSMSRSPGRRIQHQAPLEIIEWPPCFDNEGSAFIFHPASGMFYEEQSDFFYDPKAKVYYGVKKGAYFRYDDSRDPPFVETQRADPTQGTPLAPVEPPVTLPSADISLNLNEKTRIAIKLKTKKVKKPKDILNTQSSEIFPMPAPVSKVQKEQVANIEKWKEKQAELKALHSVSSGVSAATAAEEIKKTVSGEPICVLCRRKFPTIDKLRLHEDKSELHKSNLAKAAQQQQQQQQQLAGEKRTHDEAALGTAVDQQQQYRDRAEKRRILHGSDAITTESPLFAAGERLLGKPAPEGLGGNNIGNRLLQKMGWQSGSGLGKKRGEEVSKTSSEDIRKDWDRIEAIAESGARGGGQ